MGLKPPWYLYHFIFFFVTFPFYSAVAYERVRLDGTWLFKAISASELTQSDDDRKDKFSSPDWDDSKWEKITVPGFWDQPPGQWPWASPQIKGGPYPSHDGEAWYRLRFKLPYPIPANDELATMEGILFFEGISAFSSVWLNGSFLTWNLGAYTPFEVKFPAALIRDTTNVLVVRVRDKTMFQSPDNARTGRIGSQIPLGFDPRSGGIHRSVYLQLVPGKRIEDLVLRTSLDSLSMDVTVSSAAVSSSTLELEISEKDSGNLIYGPEKVPITHQIQRITISNLAPTPWSPETPFLYRLKARLIPSDNQQEVIFGFRTFGINQGGFLLNEKPYFLLGAGSPPHYETNDPLVINSHLSFLKQVGVRIVRFAHEPPALEWIRGCDEKGLLAWVEGALSAEEGYYNFADANFVNQATREMVATVRFFRNHPSIVIWSMGAGNCKSIRDPEAREQAGKVLSGMAEMISRYDPTRVVISESDNRMISNSSVEDWHVDYGWYQGRVADWLPFLKWVALKRPEWTAPWVSSSIETGYSSNSQGGLVPGPVEQATARMRIGQPADENSSLMQFQAARIEEMIEIARCFRDNQTNRLAGIFPFTSSNWFYHPLSPEYTRPKPILEAIRRAYSPLLVSLALPRQHYYSGDILETTVTVVNDDLRFSILDKVTLASELVGPSEQKLAVSEVKSPPIPYASSIPNPVVIKIPEIPDSQHLEGLVSARIQARLMVDKDVLASTVVRLKIGHPSVCQPNPSDLKSHVAVYDPQGILQQVLSQFKIAAPTFRELDDLEKLGGLLIGPGGFDDYFSRSWDVIESWVKSGGRIFIFPQKRIESRWYFSGPYPGNIRLIDPFAWPTGIDQVNLCVIDHPVFKGIQANELRRWGRDGVVASTVFEKIDETANPDLRTLVNVVSSNQSTDWSDVVLEYKRGEGRIIYCQLHLLENAMSDSVAGLILKNSLRWVSAAEMPILAMPMDNGKKFLAPLVGGSRAELISRSAGTNPNEPIRAIPLPDAPFETTTRTDLEGVTLSGLIPGEPMVGNERRVHFDIDDRFWFNEKGSVKVEVHVYCLSPTRVRLDYDSADGSLELGGRYKKTTAQPLLETGVWKKPVFTLPDALFANRQTGGTDFRIVFEEGNAVVGSIMIGRGGDRPSN